MIMAAKMRIEGGTYYGFDLAETAKTFMRMPTAAKKRAWNHFYYFYQRRYENDEHNAKR